MEVVDIGLDDERRVGIRLFSEDGKELSEAPIVVSLTTTNKQLQALCNTLLDSTDDPVPISFRLKDGIEISKSIAESIPAEKLNVEKNIEVVYYPEAVFRVKPVTRCTSSLPGHAEPVVSVQFSPHGRGLASGSGDCTVRLWDVDTELPLKTCEAHSNWVLCISWSPNARMLASACKNGNICLWDAATGAQIGKKLSGHKQWITQLAWQPFHRDPVSRFLASAGKDASIKIWDTVNHAVTRTLTGHTASVTCLRWGGQGLIYSGSQDRTIKVWRAEDGVLCRTLTGHAHWVNTLTLNVEYVLRTSCFDPKNACQAPDSVDECKRIAERRYEEAKGVQGEMLASGSDDFTLYLWKPDSDKKAIARMTGHQQLVNQVMFSPDARYIASASFDKSIKLWCGRTGAYIDTLRGHVQAVYQIAWSADSRLLVSGSADSTLKVWDMQKRGICEDLPGHGDEVFAVDWSPDGERVASGGKDKVLKLWRR
ncbi:unnamed protein product [Anisakis simplex]|uniref:Notchless protein homolog 1 (inferred by orthology to a human protein) n=1 Tax=Anisakis simplex TaxID=6269 RepID=A0A0M3JSH8_ANISI|nr:unnamed protein product [Anisakis simplex]